MQPVRATSRREITSDGFPSGGGSRPAEGRGRRSPQRVGKVGYKEFDSNSVAKLGDFAHSEGPSRDQPLVGVINSVDAKQLLNEIAADLYAQAQENARVVMATGRQDAAADPYVGAFAFAQYQQQQGDKTPSNFHLPEPILHPRDNPRVLVISANPGYGEGERLPNLDTPLQEYIDFYWNRFTPAGRMGGEATGAPAVRRVPLGQTGANDELYGIGHLHCIESLLEPILGPTPLSGNAAFCDAIPWKWSNSRNRDERYKQPQLSSEQWKTVWRVHAEERLSRIAAVLDPQVVLIMGELNRRLPELSNPSLASGPHLWEGQRLGRWRGTVVSSFHPNANQMSGAYAARVTAMVRRALEMPYRQ